MNLFRLGPPPPSGTQVSHAAAGPAIASGAGARRLRRWTGTVTAALVLAGLAGATEPSAGEFGKAIELAPFVVQGKPLSISIHARTKGDRRYAEKFADEVVEVAYEALGDSTGKGLVIVGAKGEPHPVLLMRKFIAWSEAGRIDPGLAPVAAQMKAALGHVQDKFKMDDEESARMGITFETFMPALPMPLVGPASRLYQLAWAEGFDEARIERRLQALTLAELERDQLTRYDWVFYLPPRSATGPVLKELMDKGMKGQNMGVFKRAAVKSAMFAFKPVVNKAVEGMRSGFLFATILRADGTHSEEDIDQLTRAYARELMPDLKPGSGDEKRRALAAIEKQKIANAEYAKDPFVKPERLVAYDPAAYARFEGEYSVDGDKRTCVFKPMDGAFNWQYMDHKPRVFHPAGERLLVKDDGSMTIEFQVDDLGTVTGVEERWVHQRKTLRMQGPQDPPRVASN